MIPWLAPNTPFPDVRFALSQDSDAPGLLAATEDLSATRLLDAYHHGIFPWYSEGQPVLWWSTDPRMVLYTERFIVSDSLKKSLKKISKDPAQWQIRFDSAFKQVMQACAAPRKYGPGTWITEPVIEAYCALHEAGFAHSAELWQHGQLVAAAYGVCIGHMFYGESMFTLISDGSKIALAHLVNFLRQHGVTMIDCQQQTSHLTSLGAIPVPRDEFITQMKTAIRAPAITGWNLPISRPLHDAS
jgi:leucyl/phenylalanyl-tRNA---protein transferase